MHQTSTPMPEWLSNWRDTPLADDEALGRYDSLPPLATAELRGRWRGTGLHSGHPLDGVLEALSWYGKAFEDDDTVHPLLFRGGHGEIVAVDPGRVPLSMARLRPALARTPAARAGFMAALPGLRTRAPAARLRTITHRGVASAAMVYDRQPIIDHFRRIDAGRVLGLMDLRGFAAPFFFVLERDASA